jgi:hypothetical protein
MPTGDPMESNDSQYFLWDSKTGNHKAFLSLEDARAALFEWISLQRNAGEPVVEQGTGQWTDSRVTMWIADAANNIIRLRD